MDKFNFNTVTDQQRKAIKKIHQTQGELYYWIDQLVPPSIHAKRAKQQLHETLMQCNAGILFHWQD